MQQADPPSSNATAVAERSGLDRYFKITERGSTVAREIRGGLVTFFSMCYIVVLNPLIIGTVPDSTGMYLGGGTEPTLPAVAAGTALIAGLLSRSEERRAGRQGKKEESRGLDDVNRLRE